MDWNSQWIVLRFRRGGLPGWPLRWTVTSLVCFQRVPTSAAALVAVSLVKAHWWFAFHVPPLWPSRVLPHLARLVEAE